VTPIMTQAEIDRYEKLLDNANTVLEFGSGGSTVLAASRPGLKIVSVDGDMGWFEKLRSETSVREAEAAGRLNFVHVDIGPTTDWGKPANTEHKSLWPRYSKDPWAALQSPPDLILIDGRFRVACALEAARRRFDGAVIAIHDFNRRSYHHVPLFLHHTESVERLAIFSGYRSPRWLASLALMKYRYDPR
jgi:hypothetical protein